VEGGRIGVRRKELRDLLAKYEVADPDLRAELEQLADEGRRHPWFSKYRDLVPEDFYLYMGYEAEASRVDWFGQAVVPGQLQTASYANAILRELYPDAPRRLLEGRAALRMRRQEMLFGARAMPFAALLAEAALHHQVGGPDVLREQLDSLLAAMNRPNVEICVIPPDSGASAAITANVTILSFEQTRAQIVHVEAQDGRFEEGERAKRQIDLYHRLRASALSQVETRHAIREARSQIEGTRSSKVESE
jgi:hypothetical protein